jgi:hypothetical protein
MAASHPPVQTNIELSVVINTAVEIASLCAPSNLYKNLKLCMKSKKKKDDEKKKKKWKK